MPKKMLFLILFAQITSAWAQEKEGYWGMAVGFKNQTIQDDLITRSRYSGAPFYLMINHQRQKAKKLSFFQFEGSVGKIKTKEFARGEFPSRYLQPQISIYWNEITYSNLFLLKSKPQSKWWVGGSLSNLASVRFSPRWDNSSINYDMSGNLQAETRYQRDFSLFGKDMTGTFALKLPLIGYMTRPIYSGVPDFLDQERSFESQLFENTSTSWVGNFPRIQLDNYVEFPIAGENRMQVIYNWEYYSFQSPNRVQTASHTIAVNFLLRTK